MLDHLVYAAPDLEATVRNIGERLGVAPAPGGPHVGRGTRNYLLSLGARSYLEIIGPDPEQPDFSGTRSFGLDSLEAPQLVGWAMRVTDIDRAIEEARGRGYDPGPANAMSRRRPDGLLLTWKLTAVPGSEVPVLLPFLIDWGDTPHPSETASGGATLLEFRAESSHPASVEAALDALGASLPVSKGKHNRLIATIEGPEGEMVTLS